MDSDGRTRGWEREIEKEKEKEKCCGAPREDALSYNTELGRCVVKYKNLIDGFFVKKSNCWDQVKKYSNDYEFLFSSMSKYPYVAKVSPPSRSYFKLWEILKSWDIMPASPLPAGAVFTTAHVAEGPGGFIECVVDWMHRYHHGQPIAVHGMTLMSSDRVVPQWRLSRNKTAGRVTIHCGADGSGDLYKLANIDHFVASVGEGTCALVTGDGGFDINGQFNQQEHMMHRLVAAEMYTALRLCKPGGCVIIKIFDCFTEQTMRILYWFQLCFEDMHLVKPYSSRPANSEKYIVCLKRRERLPPTIMAALREAIRTGVTDTLGAGSEIPTAFLLRFIAFNTKFCFRQIFYICKTISFIEILYQKKHREFIDDIVSYQYKVCRDWCIQNDIPYKEMPL